MRDGTELSTWSPAPCRPSGSTSPACRDLTVATPRRRGGAAGAGRARRARAEEPILWRRNRELTITVRADIADGVQAPDVTAAILPALAPIKAALPAGYRIETGGAVEESEKANGSIFAVFPMMLLAMLTLLMVQLQSFAQVALVLADRAAGAHRRVAGALLVFDAPFGFVALLG